MEDTTTDVRERTFNMALNDEEHEKIRQAAFQAHKSMAAYIRDIVLPQAEKDLDES